jgi:hypothetical protein
VRLGFSCGYSENYWGTDWHNAKQLGGSERILIEVASALAAQGHMVTVRLPYDAPDLVHRNVRWVGVNSSPQRFDVLFCFDDFQRRDDADATNLVACRSDPPPSSDFDQLIFLSQHHASLMGHEGSPSIGGGVDVAAYARTLPRLPRRVLCTSSPDRCPAAAAIGRAFSFRHTYRPVSGYDTVEVSRGELVEAQLSAQVLIYPLDPVRPSDFFSMAVLESLAAGTPVVVSDADSMPELWGDAAIILDRPVDLGEWYETVDELLANRAKWGKFSKLGKRLAQQYDWSLVAQKYLDVSLGRSH